MIFSLYALYNLIHFYSSLSIRTTEAQKVVLIDRPQVLYIFGNLINIRIEWGRGHFLWIEEEETIFPEKMVLEDANIWRISFVKCNYVYCQKWNFIKPIVCFWCSKVFFLHIWRSFNMTEYIPIIWKRNDNVMFLNECLLFTNFLILKKQIQMVLGFNYSTE